MKSIARFGIAGILGCILMVGCGETRETSAFNPPINSYQLRSFDIQGSGSPQQVRGASVTQAFFQSGKALTLVGRGFLPEEYGADRQHVVMLSYKFWQRQFGGNPQIIGKSMDLNGQTFTVIGVMPSEFDFPAGVDVWLPAAN